MQKFFYARRPLLVMLLFAAPIIVGGIVLYARHTCGGPECFIVKQLGGYQKADTYQYTDRSYGSLYTKGNNQLRTEVWFEMERPEAEGIIKSHIIRMYTLYEKAVSPYPGEASNTISCVQQYRPTHTTDQPRGRETHFFTGYTNDRLTFGACADDLVTNKAGIAMFYCAAQKRLYKLELFSPLKRPPEEFEREVKTIKTIPCE